MANQYTVKSGDTLSKLAQQFGYGADYSRLAKENNISNPNLIRVGQTISYGGGVPAPAPTPQAPAPVAQPSYSGYSQPQQSGGGQGVDALIAAMTQKGHSVETAKAAIAGRGYDDLAREYLGVQSGGGGSDYGSFFSQPSIDLPSIYKNLYDNSPISSTQAEFDTLSKELLSRQTAYNDQTAKVQDNPYLSEATMTGRLRKLSDKFNGDSEILTKKQAVLQNKIATSKADIETQLNLQTKQFDINSQQAQNALQQFNSLLSAGALDNASGTDIANITRSTGLSSSMIYSAVKASKARNTQTQTVSYDDGQTSGFVTINAQTGEIINKQAIGASAKAATASASGGGSSSAASTKQQKADADIQARFEKSVADGIKQLQSGSQWGEVWNRIHTLFPDAPAALIDSLLGPQWKQAGAYQAYVANKKGI